MDPVQEHETAKQNAERDPEVKIGCDCAKDAASAGTGIRHPGLSFSRVWIVAEQCPAGQFILETENLSVNVGKISNHGGFQHFGVVLRSKANGQKLPGLVSTGQIGRASRW